jgi:hypothetical protein
MVENSMDLLWLYNTLERIEEKNSNKEEKEGLALSLLMFATTVRKKVTGKK